MFCQSVGRPWGRRPTWTGSGDGRRIFLGFGRDFLDGVGVLLDAVANDNDLPDDLALQLLLGAFYGMASESFSALLHDAYPMPE